MGALGTGLLAALVLVLGLGGWASMASIDGAILAEGRVEATRTRLVIQHPEGGRVAELLVGDGAAVAAGAPLLRLDGALLEAEHAIVETQYAEALARAARLRAERDDGAELTPSPALEALLRRGGAGGGPAGRAQVEAQIEGQRRHLAARREVAARQADQLERRRIQAEAQRRGFDAQIRALSEEIRLLAGDLAQHETLLRRGLTVSARVVPMRREAARLEGALGAARAERAAIDGRITEIEMQILSLRADRREAAETGLRDLDAQILELAARRRALAERLERLELRAPAAGRIHALAIGGAGAVLRPAEPLAELVPEGAALFVSVRIRPDDIDRLHPEQPVRVLLPATGARERVDLAGRVARIPPDALEDARSGQPYFRVEVSFDTPSEAATLTPGLPVEAQIGTGARSPLAWFLAPVTAYLGRAMREA